MHWDRKRGCTGVGRECVLEWDEGVYYKKLVSPNWWTNANPAF